MNKLQLSKLGSLFQNSFYYGLGNLVQKFLSVILLPIYTRYLAPEDYGVVALVTILTTIIEPYACVDSQMVSVGIYTDKESITEDEVFGLPCHL